MRTGRNKYLVLIILACAFVMAGMCADALAEDKKADKGKRPGQVEGKKTPMTEKRAMNVLKQIEAKDPALAKKLLELKKTDPKKFREELSKAAKKYITGKGSVLHGHREKMKQWEKERNAEYIAWLKNNYPEEAAILERIQNDKPGVLRRHIRASKKIYGEIMETQKENPRLAEILKQMLEVDDTKRTLIKKVQSLGEKINKAKGPQRDKLIKELKEVLSVRFDLIIVKHKLQHEALEEKIKQLNKQIAEKKAETEKFIKKRDEEIAKRMKKIIKETK